MLPDDKVTLADLTRLTGAKRRTCQLWAEAAVIRAEESTERAGAGTHRVFSYEELLVACIIAAVALDGCPIGQLLKISNALRIYLKNEATRERIDAAIKDEYRVFLVIDRGFAMTLHYESHAPTDFFAATKFMDNINRKASIVFLNGCFAGLRYGSFPGIER